MVEEDYLEKEDLLKWEKAQEPRFGLPFQLGWLVSLWGDFERCSLLFRHGEAKLTPPMFDCALIDGINASIDVNTSDFCRIVNVG